MKLPLDRSVARLVVIAALATTGCVATPDLRATRGTPSAFEGVAVELPAFPDATELLTGEERPEPYRVGPLDEISVQVFGRRDLGSQTEGERGSRFSVVGPDGRIHLPLVGSLEVVGMTTEQITGRVHERYAKVVENVQVEVQMLRCGSRPVDLVGAFVEPGRYYICDDVRTVADALRAAGGLSEEANHARGTLSREGTTFRLSSPQLAEEGDAAHFDVTLVPGDVIHFPVVGEQQVFVFGEVGAQGPYPIPPKGLTLVELLALAEGWNGQTTSQSVYLLRPGEEGVHAFRMELGELLRGPGVPLADGDRVYVAPTRLARWSWWWRQAIPSFFLPRYSL